LGVVAEEEPHPEITLMDKEKDERINQRAGHTN
jgi:hypothetical protein